MAATEGVDSVSASVVSRRETYDSKCIFCKIVAQEINTELLYRDEELVCFKDIKPGAPYHFLVVPADHVGNCKTLTREHIPLVKKMVEVGKKMLHQNNVTDPNDIRLGFHWPPFCSVAHLHLHVLAPVSQMGFMSRLFYRINSYWFVTADQLIEKLNALPDDNQIK